VSENGHRRWYDSTGIIYGLIGVLYTFTIMWATHVEGEMSELRNTTQIQQVGSATILSEIPHLQEDVKWIKTKIDKTP